MKTLAVLLPTYNAAPYLRESIDSILKQTYSDFDLYVYDDCSVDDTVSVIREYNDERLYYVKNKENLGISKTLNRGLKDLAHHYKYIARMDADDWAHPERFEKQLKYLQDRQDVVLCGTQGYWTKDMKHLPSSHWTYPLRHEYLKYYLLFSASFNHQSVIYKTEFLKTNTLGYDEGITTCEDWALWTKVVGLGRVANLPEFLMTCRILPYSNHHSPLHRTRHLQERSKIISAYWQSFGIGLSADAIFEFYYKEVDMPEAMFLERVKVLIKAFNQIYNKAQQELTLEERQNFRYMLARRILGYWKRTAVSRTSLSVWRCILREVTFMPVLKLIKSLIR